MDFNTDFLIISFLNGNGKINGVLLFDTFDRGGEKKPFPKIHYYAANYYLFASSKSIFFLFIKFATLEWQTHSMHSNATN